jgi:hypothetical protein
LTRDQHAFHLKHFELLVESVWHSHKLVHARLTFFFGAIFAAVGGIGALARIESWESLRILTAVAAGALALLGSITLGAVESRMRATHGFLSQIEEIRNTLGNGALAKTCGKLVAREGNRPISNEGTSTIIALTNSFLICTALGLGFERRSPMMILGAISVGAVCVGFQWWVVYNEALKDGSTSAGSNKIKPPILASPAAAPT